MRSGTAARMRPARVCLADPCVRPKAYSISVVEVHTGACLGSVTEGNCVAARRGGEQLEVNEQSVG